MKVLLVDDNQDITDLFSKFLKAKGYENVTTNDSREALERIKTEMYDVIFLDLHMPELSGLEIIQDLEAENILKDQNIILFSAQSFTAINTNNLLKKKGIASCLEKPLQLSEILAKIAV